MTLPFAKQALSEASADDLDEGVVTAIAVSTGFLSDGTPSLLVVPGVGSWWCHVDPLELGDDTGCVHADLEGPAGDRLELDGLFRTIGLALPVADPVRGDDGDR